MRARVGNVLFLLSIIIAVCIVGLSLTKFARSFGLDFPTAVIWGGIVIFIGWACQYIWEISN